MTAEEFMVALNTAAMVLGYLVLIFLVSGTIWIIGVWHDSWAYKRRRKRRHDMEWDLIRSKWLEDPVRTPRTDTLIQPLYSTQKQTDILDAPVEFHYEEQYRDAS